ncbi:hypothetical protein MKW92_006550 [Papaver armeniacum]|nr:hypothetical protein MKW92_006550 [Papaver armeniacum]
MLSAALTDLCNLNFRFTRDGDWRILRFDLTIKWNTLIIMVHQLHGLDAADGWKNQVVNKSDMLYMGRGTGELLGLLPGPAFYASCAGWNPRKLPMLVFASDDRTTPVRCSNCVNLKPKETHENRVAWRNNGRT